MKTVFILFVTIVLTGSANAQDRTEIEIFKARFNQEKIDLVASFMDFTVLEGQLFWSIYKDYELERSEIADTRIKLLYQYANNYENLTNAQADYWSKEVIKLQQHEIGVKKKYYKKIAKGLTPLLSLRFFQFEESLQAEVRSVIMQNLPVLENY